MNFNPRSREGSDQKGEKGDPFSIAFQSTLPRGERQDQFGLDAPLAENFNPRSREGSDFNAGRCTAVGKISIHAPARGATVKIRVFWIGGIIISIHAPARGATAFIDIFSFTVRLYFISSH